MYIHGALFEGKRERERGVGFARKGRISDNRIQKLEQNKNANAIANERGKTKDLR